MAIVSISYIQDRRIWHCTCGDMWAFEDSVEALLHSMKGGHTIQAGELCGPRDPMLLVWITPPSSERP